METLKLSKNRIQLLELINSKPRSYNSSALLSEANRESLRHFVKYLSDLKSQGGIDEKQFNEVLIAVCANFIENEVETRITK
jgi:hypothetical protein